nr:MAG TPA: hypothetical protein [Caudoviricetes sp.]
MLSYHDERWSQKNISERKASVLYRSFIILSNERRR